MTSPTPFMVYSPSPMAVMRPSAKTMCPLSIVGDDTGWIVALTMAMGRSCAGALTVRSWAMAPVAMNVAAMVVMIFMA